MLSDNLAKRFGSKDSLTPIENVFGRRNSLTFFTFLFFSYLFAKFIIGYLIIFDSNIVNFDQSIQLIKLCEFENKKEFKLLYRASRDGFSSKVFHSKCDKIPKTLTIIKVKDKPHIFGGYTEATWEGGWIYKKDPNAFIFSLVNNDNKPIKMIIDNENIKNAIFCDPSYGPVFGRAIFGSDFYIVSYSNSGGNSFSDLGYTYQHPIYKERSNSARSFLAGSYNFSTSEIEVFQVV